MSDGSICSGRVIRSTGSWYEVQTSGDVVSCTIRGKFRLSDSDVTNPVVVGDLVDIELNDDQTGVICTIRERRNKLIRRAAGRRAGREHIIISNIDSAWMIQSVKLPKISPGFIDRFLVMAGIHEITPGLVINKIDLLDARTTDNVDHLEQIYTDLGIPVVRLSAATGDGVSCLMEHLTDKTSVFVGPSGAGKSTLLNQIQPSLNLRTGEISESSRKGRHTTTRVELYPLSEGSGFVADTPGLREFGLVDLRLDELGYFFVEFERYRQKCRFPDCTHDHEPGCEVKLAVEAGGIAEERYRSYCNILSALDMGDKNVGR